MSSPPSVAPTRTPAASPTASPSTTAPTLSPFIKPVTTKPSTSSPTLLPSLPPSTAPTLPTTDCRTSCTLHAEQVVTVSATNHIDNVLLPPSFTLVFTVTLQTIVMDSNTPRRNFFEISDTTSGAVLFSISTTESRSPRISYGGNVLTEYGPAFNAGM